MSRNSECSAGRECPICSAGKFWIVSFLDPDTDRVTERGTGYFWRLCCRCGNASPSVKPSRESLQAYWESNRIEESAFRVTEEVWQRRLAESRIWGERTYEFVQRWATVPTGRFLDVGCGLGGTVSVFAGRGWQASGLDPDPNTKVFHDRQNIETQIGCLDQAELSPPYDVICMAHAIYFVEEPREFLARVRKLLSPSGLFVVVNTNLFSSMNVGRPGLPHTWYPTRHSCVYLFQQEGFELMASKSVRGSDMLLFRVSATAGQVRSRPWHAWLLHKSQTLRYRTLGSALNAARAIYRKVRRGWFAGAA